MNSAQLPNLSGRSKTEQENIIRHYLQHGQTSTVEQLMAEGMPEAEANALAKKIASLDPLAPMQIGDIQDNLSKYRQLKGQRNILIFLLFLLIPLSLWGIDERRRERAMYERLASTNELGASAQYWNLYYESNSGFDEEERERFQDERNMISFPYGVTMLFTYLIFLMWLYDCRKNVELWAIGFKYSPKWIILGILIPIANLILPALVITEIWKASNPKLTTYANTLWRKSSASLLIVIWWLTYILLKAWNREPYPENRQSLADYIASTNTDIQAYLATIPVAILTIFVVWALTRRQEVKYVALSQESM